MAEEQLISTGVVEALKLIVSGGFGAAIASCIGTWFVNKKLQAQKLEHDQQIASLQSKLQRKHTVHKLQFEKEFQLYGELWPALFDVKSKSVITPTLDRKQEGQSFYDLYDNRYTEARDAFNKANKLFNNHRPFYHDDVSKITRNILGQCRGYIRDVGRMLSSEEKDNSELFDKADELLKKLPEAIDEIEKAIKGRIGLLQEAEIIG